MRIAFTHNLKISSSEEEAEFDTPQTVEAIVQALTKLGHDVEKVEVSGPASRLVARLEALNPDLIFNTAEGRFGRYREAFFPALFEQLGLPFTGSDAYTCALTLDKQLTKTLLMENGIRVPRGTFIQSVSDFKKLDLRFPVIIKPNYEGSSKGITKESIIKNESDFAPRAQALLHRYPAGILVEEFILGKDIAVPYLEKAKTLHGGALRPIEYRFDVPGSEPGFAIYDFDLKNSSDHLVSVRCPAEIPSSAEEKLLGISHKVFHSLGIRDLGRIDFRVTLEGDPFFIEINALPSLEPGAGLYQSAALGGIPSMEDVLGLVIQSASDRYGLGSRGKIRSKRKNIYRVGLTFNLKRTQPDESGNHDDEAEYDSPKTISLIRSAIESFGHEVIELEATPELPALLGASDVDLVFNIAEGIKGRNREAQIPALLELLDIPYTGSDPATLSLTLDKALAKRILRESGIPISQFTVLHTGKERLPKWIEFPVIVKPVAEGSSKGVIGSSVVKSEEELRKLAADIIEKYHQPALVEEFLPGREFTVGLLGEKRPRILPPMEIVFSGGKPNPVYTFQHKLNTNSEVRYDAPAKLDPQLKSELERSARNAFIALGCRDVARMDFRLDKSGRVCFMECNPLPGLTPGWSDLCMIAESAGMDYRTLIGEILSPCIRRLREKRKVPHPVQPLI